ncbi:amidase [Phreatobacter stygius]|uniref:Indoleacetamide hydrolase n=1 Tax=Phreatobacter stygius TaxID=1940610 RepID=A0A4D7BB66_9HYPH|nr:amidase [Phreatobacter stygius]QCI65352.1 amidase [Phreatobacter stygius]
MTGMTAAEADDDNVADLGLAESARRIAAGALDPVELIDACLARIGARDPELGAFVHLDEGAARQAAMAARQRLRSGAPVGPLHGIAIGIKDIIDVQGQPTRSGSLARSGLAVARDAVVCARLRAAGAIIVGKLATYELAYGTIEPDRPLPGVNPWNPRRWTGASSSGSAVAVAAGLVPAALGTDSAGSIRGPASFCGVTGFKPSYGRIPLDGIEPLAPSLDHCGVFTRSAEDAALLFAVLADPAVAAERRLEPDPGAGLRIGLPMPWLGATLPLDRETHSAFARAIGQFETLGASVQEVTLPPLGDYHAACFAILMDEALAIHGGELDARPGLFGATLKSRLHDGPARLGVTAAAARAMRAALGGALDRAFDRVDVLITPTSPGPAPDLSSLSTLGFLDHPQLTAPANLAGLPAVSLPCGLTGNGLPIGLQIMARRGGDRLLLRAAGRIQAATDWHDARPS